MADTTTAPAKPATAAPAKAPAKKAEPKPPRYNPAGTITLLKDKEGKVQYAAVTNAEAKPLPTKNPKRGKSATWFANYKDGMTIADLSKAYEKTGGSMNANLDWDIKHGFVTYNPPKA